MNPLEIQVEMTFRFKQGGNWYRTTVPAYVYSEVLSTGIYEGEDIPQIITEYFEGEDGCSVSIIYDTMTKSWTTEVDTNGN